MNPTHGQEAKSMVEPQLPIVPGNSSSNFDLEVPIALEKDVGSWTQHPISKFISYPNKSSLFRAFTSNISSVVIPKSIDEALKIPKWRVVVVEELCAHKKNKTWNLVKLPQGKNIIGYK